MPRARKGAAKRRARKRVLKAVRGHHASAGHLYHLAKQGLVKADVDARIDRKRKKRDFRSLWVTRLNAACRLRGISYSLFINGLKKANIALNRKTLSEIAIADSTGFDSIVEAVKAVTAVPRRP
jgi:large subunit ribosomal protein L20